MQKFLDPQNDPQQQGVYRSQTLVAQSFIGDYVHDLAAATAFITNAATAEGIPLVGCFRAHFYDNSGTGVIVNWAGKDKPAPADPYQLPSGQHVKLYDPQFMWSGFDLQKGAILVAHNEPPLSHKLLLLHELAHVVRPIEPAQHAPKWVTVWRDLVQRHVHSELQMLSTVLKDHSVSG